ncbi:hypothetical protein IAR50_006688 [Cryptococcus sp. DSM 104548]
MLLLSLLPALLLPLTYALLQSTTVVSSPSASASPHLAPAPGAIAKRQDAAQYSNIKFLTTFPDSLSANETISLKWEGGDGFYNVYERVGQPGEDASVAAGSKILVNSTLTALDYTIGNYPVNSSIVFGVEEHTQDLSIIVGQEQSRVIPIV